MTSPEPLAPLQSGAEVVSAPVAAPATATALPTASASVPVELKLGAPSAVRRWFDDYWSPMYRMVAPWILVVLLIVLLVLGPQLLVALASFLPLDQLGNSGASRRSHIFYLVLAGAFAVALMIPALLWLCRPKFLDLSDEGFRVGWALGFVRLNGPLWSWKSIKAIYLLESETIADSETRSIKFQGANDGQSFKLSLKDLATDREREILRSALISHCRSTMVEPGVFQVKPMRGVGKVKRR